MEVIIKFTSGGWGSINQSHEVAKLQFHEVLVFICLFPNVSFFSD